MSVYGYVHVSEVVHRGQKRAVDGSPGVGVTGSREPPDIGPL